MFHACLHESRGRFYPSNIAEWSQVPVRSLKLGASLSYHAASAHPVVVSTWWNERAKL